MENQQNVSHGFDMLNNDDRILENIEVKTPSPLSSSADRSINEDEENAARSESSSGGSSPSDLRKRLQHLPSPNEATRLANRVINVSRRLSRKRDFYFRGETNRIEENVENEETEEQEIVFSKRSFSDLKAKDARTRRRAKIRLENARNRTMVVSKPNDTTISDLNNDSNNEQRSDRSSFSENKAKETPEQNSEQQSSLGIETLTNNTKGYSSLSARSPNTPSLYRNKRDETNDDSSRSQRNATFLHLYSSLSCTNSPKDRIELQPLSPIPSSNSSHGKYRPCSGVILQNLSSGSEAESSYEVVSDRIASSHGINRLITVTPRETNISQDSCNKNWKIQNLNDSLPSISLSSRRSSDHSFVNSSRNDCLENVITSPASRMNITDDKFRQNSNDPLMLTSLGSSRKVPRERSFYRVLDSSRSDCTRNVKDTFNKNVDEPMFFSAREKIRNYNTECLRTQPSLLEAPIRPNISPHISETKVFKSSPHDMTDLENNIYNESIRRSCEKILDRSEQEMTINEYLNSSNSKSRTVENQTFTSTPKSFRSPETILESGPFENCSENSSEFHSSNITDSRAFKQAISKCILNYDNNNGIKSSESRNVAPSSQFNTRTNENQSAASSSREHFVGEFTKMLEQNFHSPESIKNDHQMYNRCSNKITNDKELVNVPTLVLNSREVSYSTSPASKVCTERRLDTDTLIMALSNASLKQQTTKDASRNICSESCVGSKTVSRSGSSENSLSIDKRLGSTSLKSDENQSRLTTSRTSCRSSLSTRSKIPVKIPVNRSKQSIMNKFNEIDGRGINHEISPIDSSRQMFPSNSSSPEELRFSCRRNDEDSKSCESSLSAKNNVAEDIEKYIEDAREYSVNADSTKQDKYCDRKMKDDRNLKESSLTLKDVKSRTCLSLPIQISEDDRSEGMGQEKNQNYGDGPDDTNYDKPSINCHTIGDTFRSTNFSDNPKKYEETNEKNNSEHSSSSENESESSSPRCYDIRESIQKPEEPDGSIPRITSIDSALENYGNKYFNTAYEGEVFEKVAEKRNTNLFENQIGDGGCPQMFIEESDKLKFDRASSNSSHEDEELTRTKRVVENRDKLRFSLERLAADQFRRSISLEQTTKFYDVPHFTLACSSSTSKLRHDKSRDSPRFKKKSQDRFPFTISEKTSVASMKFKVPGRLGNLDEDEEDRRYILDTHPSITRLAGSGFEDSPVDIISYAAETQLEDRHAKSSGMKGLVMKFSARWKKSKRRENGTEPNMKTTSVIYKNQDYQEECESSVESCSESSLLRRYKMYESLEEKLCNTGPTSDSPDEKSTIICDKKSFNRESCGNAPLSTENPCRRYDRDDLWIRTFEDLDSDREERTKDVETANKVDGSKLKKDPYSVFFVKSAKETPETSVRAIISEDVKQKQNVSVEKKKNRVKFRPSSLVVAPKRSDEKVQKKPIKNRNSERIRRNRNMQSGCLCLRFYRMIVPISFGSISKYRSRANYNSSSVKKRSRVSSQKKKG